MCITAHCMSCTQRCHTMFPRHSAHCSASGLDDQTARPNVSFTHRNSFDMATDKAAGEDSSSNEPGNPSPAIVTQSVSSLVVSLVGMLRADDELNLEREVERLRQESVEVQQLRQDRQQLKTVQSEVDELKVENALLKELNHELENKVMAMKDATKSMTVESHALQKVNKQLKLDNTQLDTEVAHLKHLRRENDELRATVQQYNEQKKKQLQHAVAVTQDLIAISEHLNSVLQGVGESEKANAAASHFTTESKTSIKDNTPSTSPASSTALISPRTGTSESRSCLPSKPNDHAGSTSTSSSENRMMASRMTSKHPTPLQDRIAPAPAPSSHRSSYRGGDKRHRDYDHYSPPRGYGYYDISDCDSDFRASRGAPRRRSEADPRR